MTRQVQITLDGSHTINLPEWNVTYHSSFGAIRESRHVYIKAGLEYALQNAVLKNSSKYIFEMGFGTGLNALLTLEYALQHQQEIYYHAVETDPLAPQEASLLNYTHQLSNPSLKELFEKMHRSSWDLEVMVHPLFTLHKTKQSLQTATLKNNRFNIVYYDAFAPCVQPELWSKPIFQKMYNLLQEEGVLVTYSSKGEVRRTMQDVGFTVEKIPGPPGKREIVRGLKKKVPV